MKCNEEQIKYTLEYISRLQNTGIFLAKTDGLISYQEKSDYNPLLHHEELVQFLKERASCQDAPFLWEDEHHVYFSCIKAEQGYFMVGPMSTRHFGLVERHRFYRDYGIEERDEKNLWQFTLMQILQIVCLITKVVSGLEYTDQELVDANHLAIVTRKEEEEEQLRFTLRSDEEDFYRHTYQEERKLLDMVREGNAEEAVRLSKEMDDKIGKLGNDELMHWKNMSIVGITLCARAAIDGGLAPYIAYRISGFYINKSTETNNVTQVLVYRNHAIEELAGRVKELRTKKRVSGYTSQCKDYIRKHFREKIYLDDIAEDLGISGSYLSRLFKKEEGMCIQDYVIEERVERSANLLIYSDESIPRIAEYVNFPSQSYFGKVFKERKGMTPRQFREVYKPKEFIERDRM